MPAPCLLLGSLVLNVNGLLGLVDLGVSRIPFVRDSNACFVTIRYLMPMIGVWPLPSPATLECNCG